MRYILFMAILTLSACASSDLPSNFVYETSLRGEQGWMGAATRKASAKALLESGQVTDPKVSLQSAFPNDEVTIKRWGLVYSSKNWKRYQTVLDANVKRDGETVRCRLRSPERLSDAPTLAEIRAEGGSELQTRLTDLVQICVAKAS